MCYCINNRRILSPITRVRFIIQDNARLLCVLIWVGNNLSSPYIVKSPWQNRPYLYSCIRKWDLELAEAYASLPPHINLSILEALLATKVGTRNTTHKVHFVVSELSVNDILSTLKAHQYERAGEQQNNRRRQWRCAYRRAILLCLLPWYNSLPPAK